MSQTRIEVSRQLMRNLERLPERFKTAVKGAMIKSARIDMQSHARNNCRVDTGRLRASIHVEHTRDHARTEARQHRYTSFSVGRIQRRTTRNNSRSNWVGKINTRIGPMDVIVGTDVSYAKKIERMDGYMINAYEASKAPMRRAIEQAIRRVMQGGR